MYLKQHSFEMAESTQAVKINIT
ncbi:MAG: hypothetical protein K0R69_2837, partial [Clostridia bacterium]|nr:hypothetical protein [Clostridia bacterium]